MSGWPPKDGDDLDNAIYRLESIITGWGRGLPGDVLKGLSDILDLLRRKRTVKAKDIMHHYCGWRQRLELHQQTMLTRLEQRQRRDGDAAVLSDDQRLVLLLARILDEGGETTEYIRDLYDAE